MNTNIALIEETGLQVVEGRAMSTSVAVADRFGKLHKNVLRDIINLECSGEFRELNFELTSEIKHLGATTRKVEYYNITRDGFMFLAMGFTGKAAAEWKEKFIQAFNMMEQKLREDSKYSVSFESNVLKDLDALMYGASRRAMEDVFNSRFGDNVVQFPTKTQQAAFNYNLEERITTEEYLDRRGEYLPGYNQDLGKRCAKISRAEGITLDLGKSKRYPMGKRPYTYPVSIIREAYKQVIGE